MFKVSVTCYSISAHESFSYDEFFEKESEMEEYCKSLKDENVDVCITTFINVNGELFEDKVKKVQWAKVDPCFYSLS